MSDNKKGELFSVVNGKKVDAHLHAEFLNIPPEEERKEKIEAYQRVIKRGFTPKEAAEMYGLNFIEDPLDSSPESLR